MVFCRRVERCHVTTGKNKDGDSCHQVVFTTNVSKAETLMN